MLFPVLIYLLPENYFDEGESYCLSKVIFNTECYGCGLSKACKHLLHLNFEKAFEYNMISFLALPLLGVIWIKWYLQKRKELLILLK